MFSTERILILGAAGQDGTIIRKILKNSKTVSISRSRLENLGNAEDVQIQIKYYNTTELTEIISKYKPKYILNFGGLSSVAESESQPTQSFEMNYLQVTKVIAAINATKLKDYIFCSALNLKYSGKEF